MSAFVVSATHIATCAQIVREIVFKYDDNPPTDENIRMDLAMANIISVSWRYGPEGEKHNADMFSKILGNLSDAGWDTSQAELPPGSEDVNEACCFADGYTVSHYFQDCRSAKPLIYTHAEACEYLSCLHYQSCEPPDWEDSKVRMWIFESTYYLAGRMAKLILGERRVWEARDPEPVLVTHLIESPLHRYPLPLRRRGILFSSSLAMRRHPSPWVLRFPPDTCERKAPHPLNTKEARPMKAKRDTIEVMFRKYTDKSAEILAVFPYELHDASAGS